MDLPYHDFVAALQQFLFLFLFTVWGFSLVYLSWVREKFQWVKLQWVPSLMGLPEGSVNTSPKEEELNLSISAAADLPSPVTGAKVRDGAPRRAVSTPENLPPLLTRGSRSLA